MKNLNKQTIEYFEAFPSDSLLQFILSKKVILVEEPAKQISRPIVGGHRAGVSNAKIGVQTGFIYFFVILVSFL